MLLTMSLQVQVLQHRHTRRRHLFAHPPRDEAVHGYRFSERLRYWYLAPYAHLQHCQRQAQPRHSAHPIHPSAQVLPDHWPRRTTLKPQLQAQTALPPSTRIALPQTSTESRAHIRAQPLPKHPRHTTWHNTEQNTQLPRLLHNPHHIHRLIDIAHPTALLPHRLPPRPPQRRPQRVRPRRRPHPHSHNHKLPHRVPELRPLVLATPALALATRECRRKSEPRGTPALEIPTFRAR